MFSQELGNVTKKCYFETSFILQVRENRNDKRFNKMGYN